METLLENFISYFMVACVAAIIIVWYVRRNSLKTKRTILQIEAAKKLGIHEPVSLHPVIDTNTCIGSGACITACPEKDILGMVNGQAHVINAARCVGHGACFHACPVQAITLCIGTEKRGVEIPHVSREFETNIPGLYVAGELGGMGLIKNAVEQGKQAVTFFLRKMNTKIETNYDLIIVGAGPAGISASLTAAKNKLKFLTIEQDTLGGTVYNFPRKKIVMTSPMDLPLYGQLKLKETSKPELLEIWKGVLQRNRISINENERVEEIGKVNNIFIVKSSKRTCTSKGVILAIGRRGTPRKLGVPGEEKEKVAYRMIEPELINDKKVLVVGGGDAAIETALLLAETNRNEVTISYRGENFSRLKPKNLENITEASANKKIRVLFNSNVKEILDDRIILYINGAGELVELENDSVYILVGGTLPTEFLQKVGVTITKKFGEAILKHGN
ncbi:MAG: NAD(P)-binding domain-containing protein [Bacteroidetes bacterium]|nr:NAD(P)-binding domain-containing protein [Bacteroidota bacterium]MCL5737894.1 NAD(P)-binding domain-containing protein [Bacteroidota bacterium]